MTEEVMQAESAPETSVPESSIDSQPDTGVEASQHDDAPIEESQSTEENVSEGANPENAKNRVDRKSRKVRREIDELKARVQQFESQAQVPQQNVVEPQMQAEYGQPQQVVDPFTGQYLTPGTGRYEAVLLQQQQDAMTQQRSAQAVQQEDLYYKQQQDEKFYDSLDDAAEKYEDFDDVVKNDNLPLTESMIDVAKVTGGADLLYYLAKNPKEVQRISKLHPRQQQHEVAKHAVQLASKNNFSQAPAPVNPVGDTSGKNNQNSFSRLSKNPTAFKEYLRNKQRRRK